MAAETPAPVATAPHRTQSFDLWPYEEARKLVDRAQGYQPGRPVIFESGFGPSGLPHLGTMCEVLRPAYVRRALENVGDGRPARLIVFIDDIDGLRKVPESVPHRDEWKRYLGQPVARIPDPFGCCKSFADHMIDLLSKFLAPVEVDLELARASEMYASGRFDDALKLMLDKREDIIRVITPTLREENRAGWSPFMPICPACGQVNSTRVVAYHPDRAAVEFSCERDFGGAHGCGHRAEQSVLGGNAKVGWKVDWALRWYVLKVDYELYGKDLIDSARLSGQILRLLGGKPPIGFPFEMFLDEEGHKISKSVGRGVTVDDWQRYAPIEVLKYFLLLSPRRARKLFIETIPQYVDEYLDALREYARADNVEARRNMALEFVLQSRSSRRFDSSLTYSMTMNLVAALGSSDRDLIWKYLTRYDPAIAGDAETEALGRTLMDCALNYYADFIEPTKKRYAPNNSEREQLKKLIEFLEANPDAPGDEIEKKIYDLGREYYPKPGNIFPLLYRVLLGQDRGPRLGAFIRLATPARVVELLNASLVHSAS